jgi:glycerate kinase
MSKVSGLSLLNASERNPMKTSTFGTGQLIKNAVESGCKKIVLMIGGSATNEGGIGAACALGYRIADINNCSLKPIGENLRKIQKIVSPKINLFGRVKVLVATDVTSPLVGEKGATFLFGTQKGANK